MCKEACCQHCRQSVQGLNCSTLLAAACAQPQKDPRPQLEDMLLW